MEWAILCWHPQGNFWARSKNKKGRLVVRTFQTKQAADFAASNHFWSSVGVTGVQVLEYNRV